MRPKDRTDLPEPTGGERTGDMTMVPADLQQKALANTAVRQLLGARFVLINATGEDSGQKLSMGCCTAFPPRTRLTFYSYTNNLTVEVEMKGDTVGTCAAATPIFPWRAAKRYRLRPPWPDKTLALARFQTSKVTRSSCNRETEYSGTIRAMAIVYFG